ncbi:MAG: glycosyltransferase [Deltaproteobacteria bacterium]|nr:glycosyltransferase [Deltaproteobacteria bacterium]MBW2253011.1 glycosyltransferase [Deltaproteobacteria bacterium]
MVAPDPCPQPSHARPYASLHLAHRGIRRALFAVYVVGSVAYLTWRLGWTLDRVPLAYAAIFLAAEIHLFLSSIIFYLQLQPHPRDPLPPPPHPDEWRVDVFIPTYNEPPELVRHTAVAAREMAYPHRTWLCDDGRRPDMKALAETLGVGYLTRANNEHFKAGNLNNALGCTDGDIVLVLDADHVPRSNLLTRLLGAFGDPEVGFVQTPQVYYNLDSYPCDLSRHRLWHDSTVFHHGIQVGANHWNANYFVGTGALLRRSALEAIGGFATQSITEDSMTSMRLLAAGYRGVYIDEVLGTLLAPDTPAAYAGQRLRWAQGAMQILRRDNPATKPGLTLRQRLAYLGGLGGFLACYQHLVFYAAPALFLVFGLTPIDFTPALAIPVVAVHIALDLTVFKLLAAPHARLFLGDVFRVTMLALNLVASTRLLKPGGLVFRVTPKGAQNGLPLSLFLPPLLLSLVCLEAVWVGLWHVRRGDVPAAAVIIATLFCCWYAAVGVYAMWKMVRHRRGRDFYEFPVDVETTLRDSNNAERPVRLAHLNHVLARIANVDGVAPGETVSLDLSPLGLGAAEARVVGPSPGRERGLELALHLSEQQKNLLTHYLFEVSVPRQMAELTGLPATQPSPARAEPRGRLW